MDANDHHYLMSIILVFHDNSHNDDLESEQYEFIVENDNGQQCSVSSLTKCIAMLLSHLQNMKVSFYVLPLYDLPVTNMHIATC